MIRYRGLERVTIEYIASGDAFDEVIAGVVARADAERQKPGQHFFGLSVEWDQEHTRTFNCRIVIDRDIPDDLLKTVDPESGVGT